MSSMDRWAGRVALVTGGSAGLGKAIVEELVKHGMIVVTAARNIQRLEDNAKSLSDAPGRIVPVQCDLRQETQILAMFEKIQKELGRLDICVNNAGLAFPSCLSDGKTEHWREMLEVNVLALSICTREALKLMKTAGVTDGHIVHISSMSGHRLEDGDGGFLAATKHAVRALTEGLRRELRRDESDIRITSISPGNAVSEFTARKYGHDEELVKQNTSPFKELDAKDIADAVIYAISAPPHVQIFDVLLRPNHQPT